MGEEIKNLKVYTSSLEEILYSDVKKNSKRLDSGYYGRTFIFGQNRDKVIKLLREPGNRNQYEMLSYIKNLNLPNFYLIYDILSNEKSGIKTYAGTISKYYKSENLDLWEMPSSFIIDNVKKLFEQASILGEKKVIIWDMHKGNLVVSKEGIITIDADDNRFSDECEEKENINAIRDAVIKLLASNYLKGKHDNKVSGNEIVQRLRKVKSFNELSIYEKPIDWFNDNIGSKHN